ncbi:unnamed protein product, partial [Prorocentrum cordatum]
ADAAAPVSAPPSPAPPPRAPAAAAANRPSAADRAERALRQAAELRFRDLHSMFQVLDRGNNGYVSGAEFVEALSRDILCSFGFSEADLAELAGRFDLNGDGFVSFNEFAHYLEGKALRALPPEGMLLRAARGLTAAAPWPIGQLIVPAVALRDVQAHQAML